MQNDLISKKQALDFIKEEMKQDRPDFVKIRNIERFVQDLPSAYDPQTVNERTCAFIDNVVGQVNAGVRDLDFKRCMTDILLSVKKVIQLHITQGGKYGRCM